MKHELFVTHLLALVIASPDQGEGEHIRC
jgi:hypothetical protein